MTKSSSDELTKSAAHPTVDGKREQRVEIGLGGLEAVEETLGTIEARLGSAGDRPS